MGDDVKRVPTGVSDFDSIIKGGLPGGSVVLLLGDVGAGQNEFVYTSLFKIATVQGRPEYMHHYLGSYCDYASLPEKLCYITFVRPKEDILREVATSFDYTYYEGLKDKLVFKDFSANYFRQSIVPASWTNTGDNGGSLFESPEKEDVLNALVKFLDENARNALVVIDSLTDLVISKTVDTRDLITVLRGMQRAAKRWGGIVYLLLTKDILDPKEQQMIVDSVDGVIVFEWQRYTKGSGRQRYMYIEKFMTVLPHVERDRIARFPTMVSAKGGLVVINMDKIM
ncbi:MAG: RAD55 family ATPase [Methanobacteriota archaeon]